MKNLMMHIPARPILFVVISFVSLTINAQTKDQLLLQLQQHKEALYRAYTIFLDNGKSDNARLTAVSQYNSVIDEKQLEGCVKVAENSKESDAIRAAALSRTYTYAATNNELFNKMLGWVTEARMPLLRRSSLNTLELITMGADPAGYSGQQITALLHKLMTDKEHDIRLTAYSMLARIKDEYALTNILQNLNKLDTTTLTLQENLGLLYAYPKRSNEIYNAVYKVFNTRGINTSALTTSIRLLGTYQPSLKKILSIYQDARQLTEVRIAAFNALEGLQTDELQKYMRTVVFNEKENDDMRIISMRYMMYHLQKPEERVRSNKPDKFSVDVNALAEKSTSEKIRSAAKTYVLNVNSKY